MSLSSADKYFLEKRERRTNYWPFFGVALLLLVVVYGVWLWVKMPHLINPWQVVASIEAGALSDSKMGVMVVMLPVVVDTLLLFTFVVILLWFVAFYNERRLIRLVRRLEADIKSGEMNVPDRVTLLNPGNNELSRPMNKERSCE
ncbi:MAG: hypothetical protein KDI27_00620 [Gammaproteobacteria bacterium]|nr:hypothetical protein [Gammaproteobacteria bacterium]MCB1849799.1 hypothetical protein [Gammaproteobacteria bacterium]